FRTRPASLSCLRTRRPNGIVTARSGSRLPNGRSGAAVLRVFIRHHSFGVFENLAAILLTASRLGSHGSECSVIWQRACSGMIEAEERQEVQTQAKEAANAAKDAVWADYRFIVFTDNEEPDRLRAIDLGAGHSSSNETISGRVLA